MDRKLRWDRSIGTIGPSAVNGCGHQAEVWVSLDDDGRVRVTEEEPG